MEKHQKKKRKKKEQIDRNIMMFDSKQSGAQIQHVHEQKSRSMHLLIPKSLKQ